MAIFNADLSLDTIHRQHPRALEGMVEGKIRVAVLKAGTVYKFASSGTPWNLRISSPWWFTAEAFEQIKSKWTEFDPDSPGEVARAMGAISHEFTKDAPIDQYIEATVGHPTNVFMGPGKAQYYRKRGIYYDPPKDLLQMYIPGLRNANDTPSDLCSQLITEPWPHPLATSNELDILNINRRVGTLVIIPGKFTWH